jgi:hypothetical protein
MTRNFGFHSRPRASLMSADDASRLALIALFAILTLGVVIIIVMGR